MATVKSNRGQRLKRWNTQGKDTKDLAPGSLDARMSKMQKELVEKASGERAAKADQVQTRAAKEAKAQVKEGNGLGGLPMPKDEEEIKKQKLWAEAQIKELTRQMMDGNLVEVAVYEERIDLLLEKVRELFQSIPDKFGLYYSERNEEQIHALQKLIAECMEELEEEGSAGTV